jgi:hypothetical protein
MFLLQSPTVCYSVSVWRDSSSIPKFGTSTPRHIPVARSSFGKVRMLGRGAPEIWSTKWTLRAVSNNLRWKGFDLGQLLADEKLESAAAPSLRNG